MNRLLRASPGSLSVVMLGIPILLVACGFALTFRGPYWQRAFPVVGMIAAIIQWVSLIAWEWVVATHLVRISGERPGIRIRLFKLAFASAPLALASVFALAFWWPTAPDTLLILASAIGTLGLLYGLCFVAFVVTRAGLGSRARTWHVVVAAVSLWAWAPLTACLLQRAVNKASLRLSEAN